MSHEMAALLLSITIQKSLTDKKPIFVLLLDAKSAFDLVIRRIFVRCLYLDSPKTKESFTGIGGSLAVQLSANGKTS